MKILIVGCGSIGLYFGSLFHRAGLDVTFLARPRIATRLRSNGLRVESIAGNFACNDLKVVESVADLACAPDVALFCVKTYDTEKAAGEIASCIGDGTTIISLQNGIDNDTQIAKVIRSGRIFPGNALIVVKRTVPGDSDSESPILVQQTGGLRKLVFGERQAASNTHLESIAERLQSAAQFAQDPSVATGHTLAAYCSDIEYEIGLKYALIVTWGLMAALRCNIGDILDENSGRLALYRATLTETIEVLTAAGVRLRADTFDEVMKRSLAYLKTEAGMKSTSSMARDLAAGLPTEVKSLNGLVVELALRNSVAAPLNTLIYSIVVKAGTSQLP
jgi:2-dehydropantoate 2-reductase